MKKVLAMLIAMVMMIGTVGVVAEPAEETVTRAEFARTIIQLLALDGIAFQTDTEFYDVSAEHPLSGYIFVARGLGNINGDGYGNFRPDDEILVVEAITMLVRALGYTPVANVNGGFPHGYKVSAANERTGFLSNPTTVPFNNFLTTNMAQIWVNRALDMPMMIVDGWDVDGQTNFIIADGIDGAPLQTLRLSAHGDEVGTLYFNGENFITLD